MKISLEFDEYEERRDALIAIQAVDYLSALEDIREKVRGYYKHHELGVEAYQIIEDIYRHICESISCLPGFE